MHTVHDQAPPQEPADINNENSWLQSLIWITQATPGALILLPFKGGKCTIPPGFFTPFSGTASHQGTAERPALTSVFQQSGWADIQAGPGPDLIAIEHWRPNFL